MKELSIKEKAKAYDEAKYIMKEYLESGNAGVIAENTIKKAFPELAESEDERIRKCLLSHFSRYQENEIFLNGITMKQIVAWLEKQGEHAKFLNKIQIGDKVTRNQDGVLVNLSQLERVAKPAEEYNITGIKSKNAQGKLGEMIKNLKPVNEVLEQKPVEWSEEDENRVNRLIAYFEDKESFTAEDDIVYANWLKSLRPRSQWKPSDEQMDALRYVTNFDYGGHKATLVSLYEQLKKL